MSDVEQRSCVGDHAEHEDLDPTPASDDTSSRTTPRSAPDTSAALPDSAVAALPDLIVALPAPASAAVLSVREVGADDCELYEGCLRGAGRRSLLKLSFTVLNQGDVALELGRPFEADLFHDSSCQNAYVAADLLSAELRDATGALVAWSQLTTACVAGGDGVYDCTAQGLSPGDTSRQPVGRCDFLDVTGLPDGTYTLKVTVNPERVVAESNFSNNSAEVSIRHSNCDGTPCGGACCPQVVACLDEVCMLPDLQMNAEAAEHSVRFAYQRFAVDSCELEEMCVSGSGRRLLLQFEGRVENWGPGDLDAGDEHDNPLFEYSSCHEHFHFRDFTQYQLLDRDGAAVAVGHKQSFCLVDMQEIEGAHVPAPLGMRPPAGHQACSRLSAGWADIYGVGTPCQWIDVTDVPLGDYILSLSVNPSGVVPEASLDNNTVRVPVHIPAQVVCEPETEVCGDGVDQDCDELSDFDDPDCNSDCLPKDLSCGGSMGGMEGGMEPAQPALEPAEAAGTASSLDHR
jgi:hypothetical protein